MHDDIKSLYPVRQWLSPQTGSPLYAFLSISLSLSLFLSLSYSLSSLSVLSITHADHVCDTESRGVEAMLEGVEVKLTEEDIPGASLGEPLETHTIPELKI